MIRFSATRHQNEPIDLPADEIGDQLLFSIRILACCPQDHPAAVVAHHVFDTESEAAVVGVTDISYRDTDETTRLAGSNAARVFVSLISEDFHRVEDFFLHLRANIFTPARVLETVIGLTPARRATSLTVGCLGMDPETVCGTDSPLRVRSTVDNDT